MGFLASALGGGNNFQATSADITQDPNALKNLQSQYGAAQGLTQQQQGLANALQSQASNANGLNFGAAQGTLGQGQQLLSQLMSQGQGQGPNPALEQLRQTTGQNIQQTTGQIASQKGINPAMAARLAAQSGAAQNQAAAGQAATLSAQQQLAAQQAAGSLVGQQAAQQAALAQAQGQNQQAWTQMLQNQQAGMGAQNLQQQNLIQNQIANANNAKVGMQSNINNVNAGVAQQNAAFGQQMAGGLLNGLGSALGLSDGGEVPDSNLGKWTANLDSNVAPVSVAASAPAAIASDAGRAGGEGLAKIFSGGGIGSIKNLLGGDGGAGGGGAGMLGGLLTMLAHGGRIDETSGGRIPGQARVAGDSKANDVVPIQASPGEIMLPRSVTQAPDAPERARDFVLELQRRSGRTHSYERVAKARQAMADGGEVGVVDAIKKWWQSRGTPQAEESSRGVADSLNAKLPESLSAREPVKSHNAKLEDAYRASGEGMADGGDVQPENPGVIQRLLAGMGNNAKYNITHAFPESSDNPLSDLARELSFGASKSMEGLGEVGRQTATAANLQVPSGPNAPPPPADQASPQEQAPQLQMPQLGQTQLPGPLSGSPNPYGGIMGQLQSAQSMGERGIRTQAQAAQQNAQEQAAALSAYNDQQQARAQLLQQHLDAWNREHDAIVSDLASQKIDPHRFWSSKTTGGKIGSTIGLILGGMGSAVTGGPNPALQVLNRQMDADIDAQKTQLGIKNTLLADNYKKFGTMMEAENATRLQQAAILEGQIKLAAARSGSLDAQGRADQLIGQLRQQFLPLRLQMAQHQMMMGLMTSGGPGRIALDENSAQKAREGLQENDLISQKVAGLQAFAAAHPQGSWNPADRQHAQDLLADLTLSWNKAQENLNRLNENEYSTLSDWLKNPASLYNAMTGKAKVSINDLAKSVAAKRKSIEGAYLVPGSSVHPAAAMLMPELGKRMVLPPPARPGSFAPGLGR